MGSEGLFAIPNFVPKLNLFYVNPYDLSTN